jgi:hypothetical protein
MTVKILKYKVVLIEEGLGNLQSCFYYTREALEHAAKTKLFEGKKCYADHPDAIQEKVRPERSVRDIIGYFQDIQIEDGVAGQAILAGTLCLHDDQSTGWAKTLIESSLGVSGKFADDIIGLSINASGKSNDITLESFMESYRIPISAQPKLEQARAQGITEIELCTQLTDAVSVDLVTNAGAKGRIVKKVLESEKIRMAKKIKKPGKKKVKEAAGHADEEQDKKLISDMLKKYVGGDDEPTDEECQAMHQALSHAKEMGMEGEEAEKCAGYSMKMAKHVASKTEKPEADDAEETEAEETEAEETEAEETEAEETEAEETEAEETEAEECDDKGDKKPAPFAKKEAAYIAKIEKLEKSLKESGLEKHIEKVIKESGLPAKAVTKFRECLGKPENEKEVSDKLKLFKEAFTVSFDDGLFVNPEKSDVVEGGFSLADCVTN